MVGKYRFPQFGAALILLVHAASCMKNQENRTSLSERRDETLGSQSILDLIAPLRLGMTGLDIQALFDEPATSKLRIEELVEMADGVRVSQGTMTGPSSLDELRIVRLPNGIVIGIGMRDDRIAFFKSSDARLRLPNGLGPGSTFRDVRTQMPDPVINEVLATCIRVKVAPTAWLVTPQWELHNLSDDTMFAFLEIWPEE